jgi:phage portal protein BeeE
MVTWKPIAGHEGCYEVSDDGRVRSLDRVVKFKNSTAFKHGREIVGSFTHNGYRQVILARDGKNITRRVHHLVLETFVGSGPDGYVARHANGVRDDNRAENLNWATQQENLADRADHGTAPIGENNPACILTEMEARFIKYWLSCKKWTMPEIASHFGVSPSTVANIKYGHAWAWLEEVV